MAVDIVIYHNPESGTSRNTLGLIRNAGIEPHVVEYLKTPPARAAGQVDRPSQHDPARSAARKGNALC